MEHNKQVDLAANASLQAGSDANLGMKRETNYVIKAFAPIEMGVLADALKELIPNKWRNVMRNLRKYSIVRDGESVISVGSILNHVRNIPDELSNMLLGDAMWVDNFHNLVTTAGLNDSLTQHFKGSAYTAAWYVGITAGTPVFNSADIMSSHTGWTESTAYSESVRQTLTLGSVASGSVDNSASKAVFSINAGATVGGAFVVTVSTKSGTTGTLYGGGAFSGGNRTLQSGDTLSITITLTAS